MSKKTPSLRNISTHYDLWSGKTTLKTTVRTEQCSCSKERQLCKWLQQLSSVRFPRLLGMNGEANEALSACTLASSFRKMRLPPPTRRPKEWDSIGEPVVPLERNLYGEPFCRIAVGRNARGSTSQPELGKYKRVGCLNVHRKITTVLVPICGRHNRRLVKQNNWTKEECSAKRNRSRRSDTFAGAIKWLHPERRTEVDHHAVPAKSNLFPLITTTEVTTETRNTDSNLCQLIAALSHDMEGHAEKCVEMYFGLAGKRSKKAAGNTERGSS